MAAIRALEARSLEFMHEKEEKKRLEQRIAMLMGQMIRGESPRRSDKSSSSPNGLPVFFRSSSLLMNLLPKCLSN